MNWFKKLFSKKPCADHNGWFEYNQDGINYYKCWSCGELIQETEEQRKLKVANYYDKMRKREQFLIGKFDLKIQGVYSGITHIGKPIEGRLLSLECSSDGDFCNLQTDTGVLIQDVVLHTLKLIHL